MLKAQIGILRRACLLFKEACNALVHVDDGFAVNEFTRLIVHTKRCSGFCGPLHIGEQVQQVSAAEGFIRPQIRHVDVADTHVCRPVANGQASVHRHPVLIAEHLFARGRLHRRINQLGTVRRQIAELKPCNLARLVKQVGAPAAPRDQEDRGVVSAGAARVDKLRGRLCRLARIPWRNTHEGIRRQSGRAVEEVAFQPVGASLHFTNTLGCAIVLRVARLVSQGGINRRQVFHHRQLFLDRHCGGLGDVDTLVIPTLCNVRNARADGCLVAIAIIGLHERRVLHDHRRTLCGFNQLCNRTIRIFAVHDILEGWVHNRGNGCHGLSFFSIEGCGE